MEAVLNKQLFVGMESGAYFYSGAETPTLKGAVEAVNQYLTERSRGPEGRDRNAEIEMSCKENLAALVHGEADSIALLSNSSDIISMIAGSFAFRPGDNVVVNSLEFPSGILPWLALSDQGVDVRVVEHRNWRIAPEDILAHVDKNTRFVITSHVSYLSGARLDYRSLYKELAATDALLLLDVTQSLGAIPVDLRDTDFLVCSSYKWLLGLHGAGILGVNPARLSGFMPRSIGWRSVTDMFGPERYRSYTFHSNAQRFETGYPSYPTLYALDFSTRLLLDTGIKRIEEHILTLGSDVIDRMSGLGFELMTPAEPHNRAGNICFVSPDGEAIAERLREREIYVWGGDGRFRVSVNSFNDSVDVDRLIGQLISEQLSNKEKRV